MISRTCLPFKTALRCGFTALFTPFNDLRASAIVQGYHVTTFSVLGHFSAVAGLVGERGVGETHLSSLTLPTLLLEFPDVLVIHSGNYNRQLYGRSSHFFGGLLVQIKTYNICL